MGQKLYEIEYFDNDGNRSLTVKEYDITKEIEGSLYTKDRFKVFKRSILDIFQEEVGAFSVAYTVVSFSYENGMVVFKNGLNDIIERHNKLLNYTDEFIDNNTRNMEINGIK